MADSTPPADADAAKAKRLLELHSNSTPGEWLVHGPSGDPSSATPIAWQHHYEIRIDSGGKDDWPFRIAATPVHAPQLAHDYAFIAGAHNDAPAICAALLTALSDNDKLRERVRVLEEALQPFLPAYEASVRVYQNWHTVGDTSADRRASEGERRDTAGEAAHEALAAVTFGELAAVSSALKKEGSQS